MTKGRTDEKEKNKELRLTITVGSVDDLAVLAKKIRKRGDE